MASFILQNNFLCKFFYVYSIPLPSKYTLRSMSIPPYQVENAADINIIMDNSVETVQNPEAFLQDIKKQRWFNTISVRKK